MLRINEIFPTIQGEATYTGTPATFIRLQGCPVGCSWCDTKHTWPKGDERRKINAEQMLLKTKDAPTFAEMTEDEICQMVKRLQPRHFVLTGGEPCSQEIFLLTYKLLELGTVQIETSGTHDIDVAHGTWVTVSPKVNMGGGLMVLPQALLRADEIKMPIAGQEDLDNLEELIRKVRYPNQSNVGGRIWLQPVSQGDEATNLCVEQCMSKNWRISIQTHKYMGVR